MPNRFSQIMVVLLTGSAVHAQSVGIGTTTPLSSAQLDITSTTKGVLVPRMTTVERISISTPAKGLLVFDNTSSSFWVYDGTVWTEILSGKTGWTLNGNTGTNPLTNFIGTTDNSPIRFRIQNQPAGILDSASNETYFGYGSGKASAGTVFLGNTGIGFKAMNSNISGAGNTAVGTNALFSCTNAIFSTAIGNSTLYSNTTGAQNTAIGAYAMQLNTTGGFNTALGAVSLNENISGKIILLPGPMQCSIMLPVIIILLWELMF
ncbi:MAG: hypothetical protein IPP73_06380 [Chitinophagaceae bacterium]|nr:hypothetical protein [Chitinophagaceae bacterium]